MLTHNERARPNKQVDLHIDRLPRLPKEHSYKCVFNRSEQTTATSTPFGLNCPLPKLMDRQRHIQIELGRGKSSVCLSRSVNLQHIAALGPLFPGESETL